MSYPIETEMGYQQIPNLRSLSLNPSNADASTKATSSGTSSAKRRGCMGTEGYCPNEIKFPVFMRSTLNTGSNFRLRRRNDSSRKEGEEYMKHASGVFQERSSARPLKKSRPTNEVGTSGQSNNSQRQSME